MKKLWIFLVIFCMMAGSVTVHADHDPNEELIGLYDFQTVRIPEPEGEIDPDAVYFTKDFAFAPEETGNYLFMVEGMDENYDFTIDVVGYTGSFPLNGIYPFKGYAGESYTLRFQYPSYDGRNPDFTLYVGQEFNHNYRDTLALGETKTFAVPRPEEEIDKSWTYFNLSLFFTPEETGTYRFLVSYEEDESDPYDIYMAPSGAYWEIENGCQFDAQAGKTYELFFQYPQHDGRYPEFTFYVEEGAALVVPEPVVTEPAPEPTEESVPVTEPVVTESAPEPTEESVPVTEPVVTEPVPEPSEEAVEPAEPEDDAPSPPDMKTILICVGGAAVAGVLIALLIAERKKNMNPESL